MEIVSPRQMSTGVPRMVDLANMRFFFRVDYFPEIGGGHLKRCMDLASHLDPKNCKFFIRGNAPKDFPYLYQIFSNESTWAEQAKRIVAESSANRAFLVVDVSHFETYRQIDGLNDFLSLTASGGLKTVLIDGLEPDCIYAKAKSLPIAVLLTSYCGAKKVDGAFVHLAGPEFFIFSKDHVALAISARENINVPQQAHQLLVTMGQSDPVEMTLPILKSLKSMNDKYHLDLKVKVVVGPLFSPHLKNTITEFSQDVEGIFELVLSPPDLMEFFTNTDLVLTTAGLTKYQVALCGKPLAVFPHNSQAERTHRPFAETQACVSFPGFDQVDFLEVEKTLLELIRSKQQRSKISKTALGLSDGLGVSRLFKILGDLK